MDSKISNKKIELIQWLSALEDKSVIEKLMKFRMEETKNSAQSATEEEQSIEKGIKEADNQNLVPHSEARKLYEKWLKNSMDHKCFN